MNVDPAHLVALHADLYATAAGAQARAAELEQRVHDLEVELEQLRAGAPAHASDRADPPA